MFLCAAVEINLSLKNLFVNTHLSRRSISSKIRPLFSVKCEILIETLLPAESYSAFHMHVHKLVYYFSSVLTWELAAHLRGAPRETRHVSKRFTLITWSNSSLETCNFHPSVQFTVRRAFPWPLNKCFYSQSWCTITGFVQRNTKTWACYWVEWPKV